MKFSKWVEKQGGQAAVARMLDVSPQNVSAWLRGICYPRAAIVLRIISVSKNELTFNDIARECSIKKAPTKKMIPLNR